MNITVSIDDLERAINWIKENTNAADIRLIMHSPEVRIETIDKYESHVTLTLYSSECGMMPKITKTEILS